MQARGHETILATSRCYQKKIESLGLEYRAIRPESDWFTNPVMIRRFTEPVLGMVRVATEWLLPVLRESYADILAAAVGADLLVSHPLVLATRLVAEKTGIPWASTMTTPLGFFSAWDLPMFPPTPQLFKKLRCLGPYFWGPLLGLGKRATRFLARPWYRLRAEIGLPPTAEGNPLGDSNSKMLVLALFSKLLAKQQPDWPSRTVITGFPFYDQHNGVGLPAALERFLEEGPPPIVFTLGTSVSADAGAFYEHSAAAAKLLGRRAVLILKEPRNRPAELPEGVVAFDYARFTELFPRAAVNVHHGGIGTTGLAMQAGRPMLVVPHAWDQPDHADRVVQLGIARVVPQRRYSQAQAAAELRHLLENPAYADRALQVQEQLRQEDGVRTACDALEALLRTAPPASRAR